MSKPLKSSEILTIVRTNKLWIAFKVERTISISTILSQLEDNKLNILAYREMSGAKGERKWKDINSALLGRDATKFNSSTNRVESGLSTGIAALFYEKALRRIEVQRRELKHKPLSEVLKSNKPGSEAPSCKGSAPSDSSTTLAVTKKGGASAATTAIVEITLRGTPSEIFEAMREILKGAVLGK